MRRIIGRNHHESALSVETNLTTSLSGQGKHTDAVEIQREVIVLETCLLGTEHEHTLVSATNLSCLLWRCGQKVESEQLLREALALLRRALDPARVCTYSQLKAMRVFGLK